MKRLGNMSLRWKFMLAPAIGILMMMALAAIMFQFTQKHDTLLDRLQTEEFVRARTLAQLSNRMATNHAQIYELLRAADVIFYDYLCGEGFMAYRNPAAECIYSGKRGHRHHTPQEQINRMLVEAHQGEIWVSENEPAGSVFSFSLPLAGETADQAD